MITELWNILKQQLALTLGADIPIFNAIPENARLPYIRLTLSGITKDTRLPSPFRQIVVTGDVHGWSQYRGNKEILGINQQVKKALEGFQIMEREKQGNLKLGVQKTLPISSKNGTEIRQVFQPFSLHITL